ncbi:nucleoid-associated protein [Rheinheimera texasensis]|uniref:nucleoid-associated protein n=1 Tax=Rheinheimera texasensis TaxID=306205 RepID=UPI0032B1FCA3
MHLKHAVIHELIKERREKDAETNAAKFDAGPLLDVAAAPVVKLIESINKIYGRSGNSSSVGTFDNSESNFPDEFGRYYAAQSVEPIDGQTPTELHELSEKAFRALTLVAMKQLKNKSEKQPFATGGYIVFAHYTVDNVSDDLEDMLLIAMVKKRDGIVLENLVPTTVQEVDISKLHQAAKVNFKRYQIFQSELEDQRTIYNYLTFVSPKAETEASGYFIEAVGCKDASSEHAATTVAIKAIGAFFDQNDSLKAIKRNGKEQVLSHMFAVSETESRDCTIEQIENWVNALLGPELSEHMNTFTSFASGEPYNLPANFKCNKSIIKKNMRLKIASEDGWRFDFEKSLLGTDPKSKIKFSESDRSITINDLSSKVIQLLVKEFESSDDQ